jgi:hypothetical protein
MTRRPTRCVPVLLALAVIGLAGCNQAPSREPEQRSAQPNRPATEAERATRPVVAAQPPILFERAAGVKLTHERQLELATAARRFAASLIGWLYGSRRFLDVKLVAANVRRELAHAPPYIPADQRGSRAGQALRVDVALQTDASGVLTVTVADSRTRYRIPASFARRTGRWQIVHLHTH